MCVCVCVCVCVCANFCLIFFQNSIAFKPVITIQIN